MSYSRFAYWFESYDPVFDEPMFTFEGKPMFGQELMEKHGKPVPLFPDHKTWQAKIRSKERCPQCWAPTKDAAEWARHMRTVICHGS